VDKHVEIVEIIHQLAESEMKNEECRMKNEDYSSHEQSKIHSSFGSEATILHSSFKQSDHSSFKRFTSRIGRFTEKEKEWLKVSVTTDSTCLHCACSAQNDCKLRQYATESGITSSRYGVASDLPFKIKKHVIGRLWFEPAKCIRCGLCVYNTKDAFTFKGRGFNMQVVIPNESREHVSEDIAKLCPTGALYLES
jgi:ferredoxin